MSVSNKDISALIINFLSELVEKKEVSEDNADSLNVAVDCLTEVFDLDKDGIASTISTTFKGRPLRSLMDIALERVQAEENEMEAENGPGADVKVNIPAEDAAIKAKAESLKLAGNKAMASRDFELAIEKYTEAISTLPTNAIYHANRAAAYSSLKKFDEAVRDAEEAIRLDPAYSKGYSRLAFAKFAQDKPEEALEAYKKVLDIEGDNATEIMKRDYEVAKKKVEESLKSSSQEQQQQQEQPSASRSADASAGTGAGAGGMPDFSSMLGSGLGGLLNNPQVMETAQRMMQDPNTMQRIQSMMENPAIRQMAEGLSGGNMPNLGDLMNNPAVMDMAKNLFGGERRN